VKNIPHFDRQLEEYREEAAWTLWSYLVNPAGLIKPPLIYMTGTPCVRMADVPERGSAERGYGTCYRVFDHMLISKYLPSLPDFYDDLHWPNMMTNPLQAGR
jgi:hypothetical protein